MNAAPAPTIIREQVVTLAEEEQERTRTIGKPVFAGLCSLYSETMNSTLPGLASKLPGGYDSKKHVKKKIVTVLKPVSFTAALHRDGYVTLTVKGKAEFREGGPDPVNRIGPPGVAMPRPVALDCERYQLQHPAESERFKDPS